jgi:hypothetical protein
MYVNMDIKLYDFLCSNSPFYISLMKAIEELNIYPSFEKIKDIDTIFSLSTKPPLLYVNGELRSEGKYLSVEECKELLSKIIQEQK